MHHPAHVLEPSRAIPLLHETDLLVLGGSCTGVCAAVRAARMGLRVAIVEQQNCFGGVATISMVNVWHSLLDTQFERPIIGGLTVEIVERLKRRDAVTFAERSHHWAFAFNPEELKIELDRIVLDAKVRPFLLTMFCAPLVEEGVLNGAIVENKSGRGAIRARYVIDATGDGDLCHRLGLPCYTANHIQPATTCAKFSGWSGLKGLDLGAALRTHGPTFGLPEGFAWGVDVPGSDVYMLAGTRVTNANCADADALTAAEIEGRRQVRAIHDIIRLVAPGAGVQLQALPSRIGIRESRHVRCGYQLTGDDVLGGTRFPDAIANGSYRVDVHHQDKAGITLRYLDGTEVWVRPGHPAQHGRWREPIRQDPTFYQIPFRAMLPGGFNNLLVAGRMIDADPIAHAAIRVMVNMNQTGEAAGVACALAMRENASVDRVDPSALRAELARGGSVII